MIGWCNCPIAPNCPITLSDYNPTQQLVKNEAIKFQEIVMATINQEIDHAIKNPQIFLRNTII